MTRTKADVSDIDQFATDCKNVTRRDLGGGRELIGTGFSSVPPVFGARHMEPAENVRGGFGADIGT